MTLLHLTVRSSQCARVLANSSKSLRVIRPTGWPPSSTSTAELFASSAGTTRSTGSATSNKRKGWVHHALNFAVNKLGSRNTLSSKLRSCIEPIIE